MLTISAKIRKILGKQVKAIRKNGILPAVLYGPKIKKALPLELDFKEFEKLFKDAGRSTLLSLKIEGEKNENLVLIYNVERDAITGETTHVDFYQPSLEKEITASIPLIFEGEAPAIKDLGATLLKNIQAVEVRALPQNLPHEIKVNVDSLKTLEDSILIKNLKLPDGVKILKNPDDIVASVILPEKIEEEITKPIEEKIEEVEKVGEKKEVETETEEIKKETKKEVKKEAGAKK